MRANGSANVEGLARLLEDVQANHAALSDARYAPLLADGARRGLRQRHLRQRRSYLRRVFAWLLI